MGADEARLFAAEGAHVVLGDILEEQGKTLEAEIGESGAQALFVRLDVTVEDDWVSAVEATISRFGQLDILVNNAGSVFFQRRQSVDGIEMTFALNHLNYFLLGNFLLELLCKSPSPKIINVSSSAHKRSYIDFSDLQLKHNYRAWRAYGRSKLANLLFTYQMDRNLRGSKIAVNAVHPGLVATNFLAR